jgi:hypothetical protein
MGIALHTIETIGNSILSRTDRVLLLNLPQQHYAAGAGAGDSVTLTVSGVVLPTTYTVLLGDVGQAAVAFVTGRTFQGFTVNIKPISTSVTLAAGAIDLAVVA